MLSGDLETAIMNIVWPKKQASVHEVRNELKKSRKIAYSTVLTTMRNLEKKGYLVHEMDGRTYIYSPVIERKVAAKSGLQNVLEKLFDGSAAKLVSALLGEGTITQDQFESLRKEILEIRQREKDDEPS